MPKFIKKISKMVGLPPGTLVHVGERKAEKVKITIIDYNESKYQEKELKKIEECFPFKEKPTITWINIDGIHDIDIIEKIGKHFNFHPLLMEDILNTDQRPKMEDFEDYFFIILKMLHYDEKKNFLDIEQVSLIFGQNFVISFQEHEGDVFDSIRQRIKNNKGRIRKAGADYLAYAITDAIVDNYFIILEKIGEKIEDIEEELVSNPKPETLQMVHNLKMSMIFLRKSVWPLREAINGLIRSESPLIQKSTNIYLRDLYDHTIQVIDMLETFRDVLSGMLEIYLSSISNKLNEVMKTLTIIATIFIPLTFIVGIYGMNFRYMPELEWEWGYFSILIAMFITVILMLVYFKRRKWF